MAQIPSNFLPTEKAQTFDPTFDPTKLVQIFGPIYWIVDQAPQQRRALDVAEVGGGANFILFDQPINIEHAYDVVPLAPPTFQ